MALIDKNRRPGGVASVARTLFLACACDPLVLARSVSSTVRRLQKIQLAGAPSDASPAPRHQFPSGLSFRATPTSSRPFDRATLPPLARHSAPITKPPLFLPSICIPRRCAPLQHEVPSLQQAAQSRAGSTRHQVRTRARHLRRQAMDPRSRHCQRALGPFGLRQRPLVRTPPSNQSTPPC